MTESSPLVDRLKERANELGPWRNVRNTDRWYARSLRAIARHCCEVIKDVPAHKAVDLLYRYAEIIKPWAELTAYRMVSDVLRRDLTAWTKKSREMQRPLVVQARLVHTGDVEKQMIAEQVSAILSIPTQAAERIATGEKDVAHWVSVKAETMSRSQVARVATAVLKLRARHLGSEGYIWRTSRDSRVRPRHRSLEGKFFRWDDPPVIDEKGRRGHPGEAEECRCIPEPIVGEFK